MNLNQLWRFILLLALGSSTICSADVLRYHTLVLDSQNKIIPWSTPTANAFDNYLDKCWSWALGAPNDTHGLPISFLYCVWSPGNPPAASTSWENDVGEKIPNWVESARLYYQYSGNKAPLNYVQRLVDYSLDHGQTPANHAWPNFPVGTANAGDTEFRGFTDLWALWDCHVDLAADIGFSMFRMYQMYGDTKYRDKAIHVADVLVSHMVTGNATDSPWPYVINSQTGANHSRYAASWDGALQLFDLLIENNQGSVSSYMSARTRLKDWLLTYPMQNGNWVDGHSDNKPAVGMETAYWSTTCGSDMCLYLLDHPGWDTNFMTDVPKLLKWAEDNFVNVSTLDQLPGQYYGAYVPAEQIAFMYRMGYQAARLGAQYAQWYEVSGDATYKDKAYRCLSYNTYMMQDNGQSSDGPTDGVGYWWSDCYGEAPRMYYYALGAVPEWAPPDENHLLRSSSVVTSVTYATNAIQYTIFDDGSTETLRLTFTPAHVFVDGEALPQRSDLNQPGWVFTAANGVLRIRHDTGSQVQIVAQPPENQLPIVMLWSLTDGMRFTALADINIGAIAFTTTGSIAKVEFYNGSTKLGEDTTEPYEFTWSSVPMGDYLLTARAIDRVGNMTTSAVVAVTVLGPIAQIRITPDNAAVTLGGMQQFAATAMDLLGHTLDPQPTFSWSVSGGGMIDDAGLFAADSSAGGLFNIIASGGGITGMATTAISGWTIWPGAAVVPLNVSASDENAAELGVKFRSDVDGTITGIRFYKAAANTGAHVGNLWTSTGALLATVIFSNETASGWQQALFATPVAIASNTVYVASYHVNGGHYSADDGYFSGKGVDNAPLHVLADGVSGSNGVYAYGTNSVFPNQTYNAANYWVDVVFESGAVGPEPVSWYAGDMHVHRSCGDSPVTVSSIYNTMIAQDLSVVSLLADMGNGEVQNPTTDLPKVNGRDDSVSTSGRIVHWDAEWHWDATYSQYTNQALGGHIVALGLTNAYQIWREYTYPIFDWAHRQGGIAGFVHMQYLSDEFPQDLNCCLPIEYPVEVALGACDFIAEDVDGSDTAIHAYYRLLNCGFRPGLAAGSDYPCNAVIGPLLTYSRVAGGSLTYSNWIGGIAKGRTAVSRNGRNEFLDLKVKGNAMPGDEIQLPGGESVPVNIQWTANQNLSGTIELVCNGEVVASEVVSGISASLSTTVDFTRSGWLCARRMGNGGHEFHTAAVFVTVDQKPVRASVTDAQFYVQWMDNLLQNTSPGGIWSSYFVNSRAAVQARYNAAKSNYQQIASEAETVASQPLFITTASLPTKLVNVAYTARLAAISGTLPYTWSLIGGSLPPGLTLTVNGAITGTPTATGTFSFTVQVRDASNPIQTATKPLTLTIVPVLGMSIWPGTTVPGLVDSGPDSAVELGVKFKSDAGGTITGIRFYKATANTGAHVGRLWTSTGTLLGTVTFTNETASGWQQAFLTTPVAIASNTVYVASYHANNGHYSVDGNYFSGKGVDNPPLHALADNLSGGNGVYAYGTGSTFPNQSYNAANYWVDVVFKAGSPTLTSITVTPANPSIISGTSQQFAATGTYSDGSTQNITSQATWTSSNMGVATINSSGLATALSAGTTIISAALAGVTGSTVLTVQSAPLAVTTTSLSNGVLSIVYSATLRGSGGTLPYTWSIISGSLPPGLTLTANGAITGTPTTTGTFSFTVQVRDASNPIQTATKPLTLTIVSVLGMSIWPDTTVPGLVDSGPDSAVELGVKFKSDAGGTITGIRFYKATANTGAHVGTLWTSTGTLLGTVTFTNETASGWQQAFLTTPVAIVSNTVYVASYHANGGHYSIDNNYFSGKGVDNPPLHALADNLSGGNGVYAYGTGSTFPNQSYNAANYWVDVVFKAGSPTLTSITVTPANPSIISGTSQQFAATGTYSDGSTQNITSQATWTSSNMGVATINSSGLATALSAGTTIISAALAGVTGSTVLTVQSAPLAVTTTSLSNGVLSIAYSATLRGSGGTLPYTWSIISGSLPPGLTLTANGAITGTPTTTGTFSFTVQVRDASNPIQTATKPLTLTIVPVLGMSIWPDTTVPGLVDSGPDSAVELGVKFKSDVGGTITGIRFYKATANTGAHVGTLWTSTGTLLGTVTFTNETASGWQQALLTTPVTIVSNTVYVASYHANNGHYSVDGNYFSGKGVDNPPLHALADNLSGGNGVYAYGTGSTFPNQSYNAANYWVDVVFKAGSPTLTSITVTPANPSIISGTSQQFAATGTYSDGSTQNITSQATWTSSNMGVVTINSSGLATALSAGTTIISAALAGVTGSTVLTVQSAPLAVTTTSLSNGVLSIAYSATLRGSGGTLPYTWSIISGSLPPGLTLTANGAITGTPTTTGTFSFTVQVRDASNPIQTATKPLTLTIVPVLGMSIWPDTTVPGLVDSGPDSAVELGVKFKSDVGGTITGIRFYKATANTGAHVGTLWTSTGTLLGTVTFTNETASGWQQALLTTPVTIVSNTVYVASYHANGGHYSIDNNYFLTKGVDNPPLHALADNLSGGNGVYAYGAGSIFPNQTYNAANYWVDVVFQ